MKRPRTSGELEYRKLKSGGYEVASEWWVEWGPLAGCAAMIVGRDTKMLARQTQEGRIYAYPGYRWDGMSGPPGELDDTPNSMAPSLAHDIGCQLCRMRRVFPWKRWARKYDALFAELCALKGMGWVRRKFLRAMLWLRGPAAYAKPQKEGEDTVHVAP